ncbi:MAG TPA: bifunctional diaminohydroxyphosphoribosylaminopyrimidine deaminase/5-amino-6-(5-phosphoribosylamino)uracil reductase RibD [Membranihabitans sp.]|nr:bifunctional diaminohydroxyphosphoribosylaminopyrimidine deaminase/5-amino-6-(5-phosphoribosylamino)uracil reductase RibD [Membranihabitans sp.]
MKSRVDEKLLRRCCELALRSAGQTGTNPNVGSVVWDSENNKILGEGWHQAFGEDHAEVKALGRARKHHSVADKLIAVSLEPCNHEGKTPPCTSAIKRHQLGEVLVDQVDPNPKMHGKSLKILGSAGIHTSGPYDSDEGREVLRPFLIGTKMKRPFIRIKMAVSRDGFIGRSGERIKISNAISDRWVHRIRNESQAIMVGTETVRNDDPALTSRFGNQYHPIRIIPDYRGNLEPTLRVFQEKGQVIVCTKRPGKVYPAAILAVNPHDSKDMFHQLYSQYHIGNILVEGGRRLVTSLLEEGLWDEMIIIVNTELDLNYGVKMPTIPTPMTKYEIKFGTDSIKFYNNPASR